MTSVFGLNRRAVLDLVSPLLESSRQQRPAEFSSRDNSMCEVAQDDDARIAIFARGVWSRLVEPGDAVAGEILASVGATRALELVLDDGVDDQFLQQLLEDAAGMRHRESEFRQISESLSKWRQRLNSATSTADFTTGARLGMQLMTPESPSWPQRLADLGNHAPIALWLRGDSALLTARSVAVVGSRAATSYGEHVTAELVTGLARAGATIISGGAYGIDAVAHRAALNAGGDTIAVLAGGVDRMYPSAHESLFTRIRETGLLCAELPPGSSPTKWRFLQRNRLIAALAEATIVCEAGHRSGSLNTAGHAAQLARPIGAVPGPVTSAASAGCHRLLREYCAVCITSANDVVDLLGGLTPATRRNESSARAVGETDLHRRVIDALSVRSPREVEAIAVSAGLTGDEVYLALLELELVNLVKQDIAGWRRIRTLSR